MPKRSPKAKSGRKAAPTTRPERHMVRKNFYVDQRKLDEVKEYLGLDSETATIDAALDRLTFAREFMAWVDALRDAGGLEYFKEGDAEAGLAYWKAQSP
jgi:hypothetical protein